MNKEKKKILVLGATGKTGKRVLQRLNTLSWPVAAGSRSSEPSFDWDNSSEWKKVMQDIHSIYISFYPDLAMPGTLEKIQLFTKMAVENNVQHLVLLSGRGEEEAQRCEEVIKNSGVDWTIIRASWFFQNFSEGNFLDAILTGHVSLPAGDIGEPFVDADDIADVAVTALTQDGHKNKLYEVTGPRLLTFREAVNEISEGIGRPINYDIIPMGEYAGMLAQYGVPNEFVSLITYLFTEVLDGRNAQLANGVQQALGRRPTDFREFVKKAAVTGVWKLPDHAH